MNGQRTGEQRGPRRTVIKRTRLASRVGLVGGSLVLAAAAAVRAGPVAAQPAAVERFAPVNATFAVRARAVDNAIDSLGRLAGAQASPILLYLMLGRQVVDTPLGPMAQGFDGQGSLMFLTLPRQTGPDDRVLVVPVTDYNQYLTGMTKAPGTKHVRDEAGLDIVEYSIPQVDPEATAAARQRGDWDPKYRLVAVRRFVADARQWAVVSASREAALAVAAQRAPGSKSLFDLTAPDQAEAMRGKSILLVTRTGSALGGLGGGLLPGLSIPGLGGMPPGGGAPAAPSGTGPGGPGRVARELDLVAIGLEATEEGLAVTAWGTPAKDSALAAITAQEPAGVPELVSLLPAETIGGGAITLDPKVLSALVGLLPGRGAEGRAGQLRALAERCAGALGPSAAVALRKPPAGAVGPSPASGAGSLLYLDVIAAVRDAPAARQVVLDALALLPTEALPGRTRGVKVTASHEANVRTYRGYRVERVTLTFDTTAAPPRVKQFVAGLFGERMVVEFALGERSMAVATGGADPVNRTLDILVGGVGGLSGTANYRLATEGLPGKRDGEMYLWLGGLAAWSRGIAARQAPSAGPSAAPGDRGGARPAPRPGGGLLGPVLDKIEGDVPVGLSLRVRERRVDLFVPAATVQALTRLLAGSLVGPVPRP